MTERANRDLLRAVLEPRKQGALLQFGANKDGDHSGPLARAILAGDVGQAAQLIESDRDIAVLSNFRVDLVGRQIATRNAAVLEFLLERNMHPTSTHLANAIKSRYPAGVDLLLRHGLPPERPEEQETPLMTAAAMGELEIVERLAEAGADVNRSAHDNPEWTASFYAKEAGKTDVAQWLTERMDEALLEEQSELMNARDPTFRALYEHATAGEGLSTDEIVEALSRWDERYGLRIRDASPDSVSIEFDALPESAIDSLCGEIVTLCPEAAEDESALKRELAKKRSLTLWWD